MHDGRKEEVTELQNTQWEGKEWIDMEVEIKGVEIKEVMDKEERGGDEGKDKGEDEDEQIKPMQPWPMLLQLNVSYHLIHTKM